MSPNLELFQTIIRTILNCTQWGAEPAARMMLECGPRARYGRAMDMRTKSLAREAGTALAVLAIYVLTLLLPLHQAAELQRDFNALGFATLDAYSVCSSLALDSDGGPVEAAALTCPAVGASKQEIAAILPSAITLPALQLTAIGRVAPLAGIIRTMPPDHVGQSRAPPIAV